MDNGTVRTTFPETRGYLANPGMGYQGWTHEIGALEQSTEYRRGEHPQQGGFDWATLNPAPRVYDWRPIDALLQGAAARGEQAAFRVITMNGAPYGTNRLPQWVKEAGAVIRDTPDLEPDYRSRPYQEHWGTFVDALAARYDGDPRIAFIDISGYGPFNEWQINDLTDVTDTTGENDTVDSATRRHLVHMFVGGSGTSRVFEADGRSEGLLPYAHQGFQETQLVMPYGGLWASTRYVLTHYPHVGFRNDALFGPDADLADLQLIGHGITELWRSAPVVFESIDVPQPAWEAAAETLRGMGATFFHENADLTDDSRLAEFVAPIGYRYLCQEITFAAEVSAGSAVQVQMNWTNTGTARAYPRMGQDFALQLALMDSEGRVVTSWLGDQGVSDWLPGEVHTVEQVLPLGDVPPGRYGLHLAVVDQSTWARVALPLASGRDDRWYQAGHLSVR